MKEQANFGGAKDFVRISLNLPETFSCNSVRIFPRTQIFWDDLQNTFFMWFYTLSVNFCTLGDIFSKWTNVGCHFCLHFQVACPDFQVFCEYFQRCWTDFQGFWLLWVRLHPLHLRLIHHCPCSVSECFKLCFINQKEFWQYKCKANRASLMLHQMRQDKRFQFE